MRRLEPVLEKLRSDLVLLVGDVNSTLAAALVAAKMGVPVAHVEAGLRSFDRRMPEEINRVVTDALSEYLFTTEPSAERNLLAEGIPKTKVFFVGNVMIDTLQRFRQRAAGSRVLEKLGVQSGSYAVVTLHRPSNVDEPEQLSGLLRVLQQLARHLPVVFPVHPRTQARIESIGIASNGLKLVPPMGYLDFLRLMSDARLVLTDSGGIQEETTILRVACLTLRENTERPITIERGTNRLAGVQPDTILKTALEVLETATPVLPPPPLWDGQASRRILDILAG
jgi:UDP-N-acetylglucosamine 2-epimerase (non-hydrolysing)